MAKLVKLESGLHVVVGDDYGLDPDAPGDDEVVEDDCRQEPNELSDEEYSLISERQMAEALAIQEPGMGKMRFFPAVLIEEIDRGFEAVAGLRMVSILRADLLEPGVEQNRETGSDETRRQARKRYEAMMGLLQSFSGWAEDTVLELMINSAPDIQHTPMGEVSITILLKICGKDREAIMETIISRYLSLAPLLAVHMPEAEFLPITDLETLRKRVRPFAPVGALAVCRRREKISLADPFKRPAAGFNLSGADEQPDDSHQIEHLFPWYPSGDDWSRLLGTILGRLDNVQIIIRVKTADESSLNLAGARLSENISRCEGYLANKKPSEVIFHQRAEHLREISVGSLVHLQEYAFSLGVFLLAPVPLDISLGQVLGRAITQSTSGSHDNPIFSGGFTCKEIDPGLVAASNFFSEEEPFSLGEAACAFRLPAPPGHERMGLPVKSSRTSVGQLPSVKGDLVLAYNVHREMAQPVVCSNDDRMRHAFIIGQTGTGKSTMMESMIMQDIRAGNGLAVIDPHGEMVDEILGKIPRHREKDVVLFDLTDREYPPGFNMLQWSTIEERDLIVDELYQTIDRIYNLRSSGGPIFEQYFRGMLRLLMGDGPREGFVPTILDFTNCFNVASFRKWLAEGVTDLQTLDYLKQAQDATGDVRLDAMAPYITSKLSRFVSDVALQRILGQDRIAFNFDEIMNDGKILLMNLGKGRFGSHVSALIANQVVSRFKLAAMKRGAMRPEERRDFFLYVDECHNLPPGNFTELLAEARKYRLGLILATQYMSQLKGDEGDRKSGSLMEAIMGNVGTMAMFRVGFEDAGYLAPALYPVFSANDIVGLPNWSGYLRMQPGGASVPPFSFNSFLDKAVFNEKVAKRVRDLSRKTYACTAEEADDQIARRRIVWKKKK